MRLKLPLLPLVLLVAALAIAGCSGDDDNSSGDDGSSEPTATANDSGDDGGEPTATAADSGDDDGGGGGGGGGGFGTGTATLTIGDQVFDITGLGCVFSAEEARNPDFPFNMSGFATSDDGHRLQMSADIYDPSGEEKTEGEGVSHHISIDDIDDFENPSVSWATIGGFGGGTETKLTVDGKHVTGVGSFDDATTDDFEQIEGMIDASCP